MNGNGQDITGKRESHDPLEIYYDGDADFKEEGERKPPHIKKFLLSDFISKPTLSFWSASWTLLSYSKDYTLRQIIRFIELGISRFKHQGGFLFELIENRVCQEYQITPDELYHSNKRNSISDARTAYVALRYEFDGLSDGKLSSPFNKKRDFARRLRTNFKELFNSPITSLDPSSRRIVQTFMRIRDEIKSKRKQH